MTTSLVDAESVLTINLGSVNTQVSLFDVVEGQYHFVASGTAPSTADAPFNDVNEGVYQALDNLEHVTGRVLVDQNSRIIIPANPNGSGIDRLVVTFSVGPQVRTIVAGLLPDVSVESVKHLVRSTYSEVVETIGLNDRRSTAEKIDTVLKLEPDLILLAGGTDSGANRSVLRIAEMLLMVCKVLPKEKRPTVLYAGNKALAKKIKNGLEKWTTVFDAPNVRPTIDVEDTAPAAQVMDEVVEKIYTQRVGGMQSLRSIASVAPVPSSQAFGRMIRFLSKVYSTNKGVLGVDVGASSTTLAAAYAGDLMLNVLPIGMGKEIERILQNGQDIGKVMKWLPMHVPESMVKDYIWQKSLNPGMVPMSLETLAIEQAVTRQILNYAFQNSQLSWSNFGTQFEPILASGAVLEKTSNPAQSLMMLLDGLQPTGITTFILDQNGLAASLGATASINSILPVQVLESRAFLNLGTVICPVSPARYGSPILQIRLEYDDNTENQFEIRQGTFTSLPIQSGQSARLFLNPMRRTEVESKGRKNSSGFKVIGGACGVIVDARGRPLNLPPDDSRRREMIKKWNSTLGI